MKTAFKMFALLLLFSTCSFNKAEQKVVVIDVAHGGKDSGTTAEEITEKEINLSIANKIVKMAQRSNVKIILTRDSDRFLSLKERVEFINSMEPDCMLSLHVNTHANSEASGVELYVSEVNDKENKSSKLAKTIISHLPKSMSNVKIKDGNFFLLKNVTCPATLMEMGFLSNMMDKAYLMSDKGQNELAKAVFASVK